MSQPFHYILAVRQPNRKWVGIAGTNSGGCLAASETVFAFYGLKGETHWGTVESQKNYAGRSPDFRAVELSDSERNLFWFKQALAQSCYRSLAHFVEVHPDAAPFVDQLREVKP